MPLPGLMPPIRGSRPCQRCGKRYPRSADECPHCSDLSDAEVEALREETAERRNNPGSLGWLLLFVAAALVGLVVIIALAG